MRTQTTSNETIEMYLKTIAELSDGCEPVVIARVAERLGVSAVSANEMMKRLAEQAYITHERYKGVELTAAGQAIAHNVMRRQRLWEVFLVDHLHLNWSGAYEAACRLEHATSNVLAEALAAYLDHPAVCPHGNPIPAGDSSVADAASRPLESLHPGESAQIASISPTETDVYAYLHRHRLLPRQAITVLEKAPMDGPITLSVAGKRVAMGLTMAALIRVTPPETGSHER